MDDECTTSKHGIGGWFRFYWGKKYLAKILDHIQVVTTMEMLPKLSLSMWYKPESPHICLRLGFELDTKFHWFQIPTVKAQYWTMEVCACIQISRLMDKSIRKIWLFVRTSQNICIPNKTFTRCHFSFRLFVLPVLWMNYKALILVVGLTVP